MEKKKQNHHLLGEKIPVISINRSYCFHKGIISIKACTVVWRWQMLCTNPYSYSVMYYKTYYDTYRIVKEQSS